jgi:ribose-phosphate pyrophosphokinase
MHQAGAREIYLAATHGLFCGNAIDQINNAPIKEVVITDTIPLSKERQSSKVTVLSIAPLLGEAIKRIHRNESVSRLFV